MYDDLSTAQLTHEIEMLLARQALIIKYRQAVANANAATNEETKALWQREANWVGEELKSLL